MARDEQRPDAPAPGRRAPRDREPGDRPPPDARRRLERAPGERYEPPARPPLPDAAGSTGRAVVLGGVVAAGGGILMAVLVATLAIDVGLLAVAAMLGLLVAEVVRRAGGTRLGGRRGKWLSAALALLGVGLGLLATWGYARGEGSPLGPLDYLWQVFGPLAVLYVLVAVGVAWWRSR